MQSSSLPRLNYFLVPLSDHVIRRFDRAGRDERLHVEDFAQLSGATRDTKYAGTLEQIAKLVETHCSFQAVEKSELARRLLFCFLIGNEEFVNEAFAWARERLGVDGRQGSLALHGQRRS